MKRVWTIVAVFSAALCVALSAAWVRSLWFGDVLSWSAGPGGQTHVVRSEAGLIFWNSAAADRGDVRAFRHEVWHIPPEVDPWRWLPPSFWGRLGFGSFQGFTAGNNPIRQRVVPYWFLTAVAGAPAAVVLLLRLNRRRRARAGHCRKCGYDLRASKDRCPECGRPIESA